MSQTLENIVKTLGTSEPIFIAKLECDGEEIIFTVKNKYQPDPNEYSECVAKLVADYHQERFSIRDRKFINETRCGSAYAIIVRTIKKVYLRYSELKNPKQSKLFKWLRHVEDEYNHPSSEGFIALYRYVHKHGNGSGEFIGGADNPHVKNILAILDKMKDKYESK